MYFGDLKTAGGHQGRLDSGRAGSLNRARSSARECLVEPGADGFGVERAGLEPGEHDGADGRGTCARACDQGLKSTRSLNVRCFRRG